MSRRNWLNVLGAVVALVGMPAGTYAQTESGTGEQNASAESDSAEPEFGEEAVDPAKLKARDKYVEGVGLVRKAQWSEALAAFEEASSLFPNATTTYNIGACERALGRYTRARIALAESLRQSEAAGGSLPDATKTEAEALLSQIDGLLAEVSIAVTPPGAAIAIDGRPLANGDSGQLVGGVEAPGPGKPAPQGRFTVVLNPGAHVITLARKGFEDAVVNKTFGPGFRGELDIALQRLPATLKVTASEPGAIVRVGDRDVGPAPVDVLRPPGTYRVIVGKEGFLDYTTEVSVRAGEEVDLRADLAVDEPSVLTTWWFWSAAAAVVAGGIVITYAATRPEPEPPPYDGGSSGWVVQSF